MSSSSWNIENYKELLEPTRDPEEAINVDIAGTLRNFMDDSAQEGSMNFNTAALLVQGSATVYGKKVDCLYKMTMDLCDKLKNLGKEDEVHVTREEKPKSKRNDRRTKDGRPVFISTEIKTSYNLSCLSQKNQEKWKTPKQLCRPPPHLMPATEEERGDVMCDTSGESVGRCGDFALNRSTLTSSGWMLLGHVSPSLIPHNEDDDDEKEEDGKQDEDVDQQKLLANYFAANLSEDSHVDENMRNDSFPEDSEYKPIEVDEAKVLTDEQLHKLIRSIIRSATKKEDKPEPVKPKKGEKPIGKNKNIRSLPTKLKRKGAPRPLLNISYYCNFTFSHTDKNDLGSKSFEANRTFMKRLKETSEFLDAEFAKFKKEKRAADEKRKSSNDKENPDGSEEKPNDDEDKPDVEEILDDDDDDDDDDESDISEGADVDSAENIAHSDNEDVDVDIVMEPEMISESRCKVRASPSTSKASQAGENSGSFRSLTEAYMADIRKYVRQNDMTERVNAWQREVKPRVDAVVSRGPFNITEYMSDILNAFREDNSKQTIVFREFCRGKEKYEIHRYFMALMTLASDQNVSIATEPREEDCDEIFITLCSRKMHHEELESFGHSVGSHK